MVDGWHNCMPVPNWQCRQPGTHSTHGSCKAKKITGTAWHLQVWQPRVIANELPQGLRRLHAGTMHFTAFYSRLLLYVHAWDRQPAGHMAHPSCHRTKNSHLYSTAKQCPALSPCLLPLEVREQCCSTLLQLHQHTQQGAPKWQHHTCIHTGNILAAASP